MLCPRLLIRLLGKCQDTSPYPLTFGDQAEEGAVIGRGLPLQYNMHTCVVRLSDDAVSAACAASAAVAALYRAVKHPPSSNLLTRSY